MSSFQSVGWFLINTCYVFLAWAFVAYIIIPETWTVKSKAHRIVGDIAASIRDLFTKLLLIVLITTAASVLIIVTVCRA